MSIGTKNGNHYVIILLVTQHKPYMHYPGDIRQAMSKIGAQTEIFSTSGLTLSVNLLRT
jgi:hypothetical protein